MADQVPEILPQGRIAADEGTEDNPSLIVPSPPSSVLGDPDNVDQEAGTRKNPVIVTGPGDLEVVGETVNTEPSEAQKEAGNYELGHIVFKGLEASIENPKGSTRSGVDPDGNEWSVTMPEAYGYIKRTEGADGDHVDAYFGSNPDSDNVWVVDQIDPDSSEFDEHKVMLGFNTQADATASYTAAFSDGRGGDRIGAMTQMPFSEFESWLETENTTEPIAYKGAENGTEQITEPASDEGGLGQEEPAINAAAQVSEADEAATELQAPSEADVTLGEPISRHRFENIQDIIDRQQIGKDISEAIAGTDTERVQQSLAEADARGITHDRRSIVTMLDSGGMREMAQTLTNMPKDPPAERVQFYRELAQ